MIALCPGTFDPITNGHIDIIKRAAKIYEKVIVGITEKSSKSLMFSIEERIELAKVALGKSENIIIAKFDTLVVNFAKEHNAGAIVRGLRAVSDFEHEFQMAQLNRKLSPEIETIFIMASTEFAYLSSSAVKEIAQFGGDLTNLVPSSVELKLKYRYSKQ